MNMQEYYIPKHLDSPPKIVFWDVDDFMMFFAPILFGFLMEQLLVCCILSMFLYTNWRKMKGSGKGNIPLFLIYWFLPPLFLKFNKTPQSQNTLFI